MKKNVGIWKIIFGCGNNHLAVENIFAAAFLYLIQDANGKILTALPSDVRKGYAFPVD